jgi:hypothetical protein
MPSYESIRGDLKTGDLVLFSGTKALSMGIKWFTGSKWSHIGMVLRLPEWNIVLIWESTTLSNLTDIETGTETQGVQLVPLSERVKTYEGDITIRKLEGVERTPELMNSLRDLREDFKGRPYEESKIELLKSAYDGIWGENEEDLSSLFCSELVAEAYKTIGLLPDRMPANEYTPKDFSEKENLMLIRGSLGPEIEVTR